MQVTPPKKTGRTANEKGEQKYHGIKIVRFKDQAVKEQIEKALRKELLKMMVPEFSG